MLDRFDSNVSMALLTEWLPIEEERSAVCQLLADDIEYANSIGSEYWRLTLHGWYVMLCVSDCHALSIERAKGVCLRVLPDCVDSDADLAGAALSDDVALKSFPDTKTVTFGSGAFLAGGSAVAEAHRRAIEVMVQKRWRNRGLGAHSPGALEAVSTVVGRDLPSPASMYDGPDAGMTESPPQHLASRRYWLFQQNAEQHGTLAEEFKSLTPSHEGVWWIKAGFDLLQPGDQVAFYQASSDLGIHALGELVSAGFVDPEDGDRKVRYRLTRQLSPYIPRQTLLSVDAPVGGRGIWNREVSAGSWEALVRLVDGHTEPIHPLPMQAAAIIAAFAGAGLHYSGEQLATFLTALQTKGFVILSGISGTGKSKIAQRLAELLPTAPPGVMDVVDAEEVVSVQPYMANHRRIAIPARLRSRYERPTSEQSVEVPIRFGGQTQDCRYWVRGGYADIITFRGTLPAWFETNFQVGDQLVIRPDVDDAGRLTALHLGRPADFAPATEAADGLALVTHLFLPVRPDWRDSKPLLGYFNPLTREYQSTEFLRFLQRAKANWDGPEADRVAFVVILDEMNLARVEYYFADLLSILESGRDADGLTKEAITFGAVDDEFGEADLPPDLKLPPNLHVVGTVNVDETTHGFSPKVLDRAFTIELNEVDFTDYPRSDALDDDVDDATRRQVLDLLSGQGRWAQVRKERVAATVARHGEIKFRLSDLNRSLAEHHLHFGYRVFDEICAYVDAAEENGLWTEIGGWSAAFDAAVLMKVLPKFHGSRAKLKVPLEGIRDWCGEAMPRTKARVVRMLEELGRDGFTAFS